ncbi:PEP-CTERM sorting domain-containing protein [Desulfobacula toluolica]|uniref:Uncharacterized protein, DUF1555 n=1 Tax=Desulfobacula toluolica (strain DSM 7467 / Tol2) TaxID=651182 RepID=K0N939_DESTT|nr:PEP-CTERM sorting domain-containing protein [Desulfobacula toluolica]CCK80459.1 uncharacterized protein, DUF1555 [Desulfobacula toluolica Tol2]
MKLKAILSVFLFVSMCFATSAAALSVSPLIDTTGGSTLFSDNSADYFINVDGSVSGGGTATVTTGDILFTMVGINTIGDTTIGSGTSYNEVTGFTAVKIATASDVDLGPAGPDDSFGTQAIDLFQYTATPLTAADAIYFNWATGQINTDGAGAAEFTFATDGKTTNDGNFLGWVFEDAGRDYNRDGTVQAGIDSAVGGDLRLWLDMSNAGDFLSVIAPFDLGDFGSIPNSTAIDNANIALDATIRDYDWGSLIFGSNITGGNGGFSSPTDSSSWPAFDNLDFTLTASIPEPATLALFGIGLLSIAAVGRRRKG